MPHVAGAAWAVENLGGSAGQFNNGFGQTLDRDLTAVACVENPLHVGVFGSEDERSDNILDENKIPSLPTVAVDRNAFAPQGAFDKNLRI